MFANSNKVDLKKRLHWSDEIIKQWELEEERINKQIEKEKNQKERKFKNDI